MQTAHLSGGPADIARCMSDSFAAELASERELAHRARSGGAAREKGQAPRRVRRSRRWHYLAGALALVCITLGGLGIRSCLAAPPGQARQSCSTHCTTASRSASEPMAVVISWSKSMAWR